MRSLKQTERQLNDIQRWAITQGSFQHELFPMIDCLCRVALMYNSIITEHINDGHVTTADPQGYIDNKMIFSNEIYKRIKNEKQSV